MRCVSTSVPTPALVGHRSQFDRVCVIGRQALWIAEDSCGARHTECLVDQDVGACCEVLDLAAHTLVSPEMTTEPRAGVDPVANRRHHRFVFAPQRPGPELHRDRRPRWDGRVQGTAEPPGRGGRYRLVCTARNSISLRQTSSTWAAMSDASPAGATTGSGSCPFRSMSDNQRVMSRSASPTMWSLWWWVRNTAVRSVRSKPRSARRSTVALPASNCSARPSASTSTPAPASRGLASGVPVPVTVTDVRSFMAA